MKLIYLSVILFIGLATQVFALDHLVISQVLYDPIKTETGGEAIELYNPSIKDINLQSYTIKTKTSTTDVILPNETIKSKGFYLIGDSGWSLNKDNITYSIADYEDTFTLVNIDSGLALMFNGTIIDAVGWGNSSNIDTSLYEGNPSKIAKEGNSLKRLNLEIDINNNSADFSESITELRNSSITNVVENNKGEIGINISITNSAPLIDFVYIDDDLETEGIQIIPEIDSKRNITFNVSINDPDGILDFDKMESIFNGDKKSYNKTQGLVSLESYDEAGNYTLSITVYDKSNESASVNVTIEYKELSAILLDTKLINLNASDEENITIEGDKDISTFDKPTIKNIGNTKLNLGAISSGIETLPFENIEFSINGIKKTLNSDLNVVTTVLKPKQMTDLSLYMSLGSNLKKGNYYGKVVIIGIPA